MNAANLFRLCAVTLKAIKKPQRVGIRPIHLQLEPNTACNLACPQCTRETYVDQPRNMSFEDFAAILDEIKPQALTLNGLGEPFLHPDILKMIAYAKSKGANVNTTSNFTVIRPDQIRETAASSLDLLNVSVDAACAETYQKIRGKDFWSRVQDNLRTFVDERKRTGRSLPLLRLCFVVQDGNLGEMVPFFEMAGSIGADAILYQVFTAFQENQKDLIGGFDATRFESNLLEIRKREKNGRGPRTNAALLLRRIGDIRAHYGGKRIVQTQRCIMPWISAYISVEGEVRPCCRFSGVRLAFGDARGKDGFVKTFDSPAYREFRRGLAKNQAPHPVCLNCLADSVWDVLVEKYLRS